MTTEPTASVVDRARADLIVALLAAGSRVLANLDGATDADRAEADRLMEEARFRGIVLNELLAEESRAAARRSLISETGA